jgi:hypothetical protein
VKLTRRELAATLSATALLPAAQTTARLSPADELQSARDRLKANMDAMAQQQVPMATEPAFQFKA